MCGKNSIPYHKGHNEGGEPGKYKPRDAGLLRKTQQLPCALFRVVYSGSN